MVVSKNVKLASMHGSIQLNCEKPKRCGIRIGFPIVGIFDKKYERTIWDNSGVVDFKGPAFMGGSRISNMGNLVFGSNTSIICKKNFEIGNNCLFSWDITLMDTDFHSIMDREGKVLNPEKSIDIEDHCWIGCRCTILKGAKIPKNSVIASNSVVASKLCEENAIYRSNSEIIKHDIEWHM